MLIRTWNLFHGNTFPPGRRAYLREMVELVTADRPDVVCLQEVPAWALSRLADWAAMTGVPVLARGATIGPLPIPAAVGRALTAPNHGLIRSTFAGQGNALLVSPELTVVSSASTPINDPARSREPRRAQHVELELSTGLHVVVTNVHCTNSPDAAVCDAELERALRATPEDRPLVLAGDFNVTADRSELLQALTPAFSPPLPHSIDQIMVRGAEASTSRVWAGEERRYGLKLLSDHAPVEVTVEL